MIACAVIVSWHYSGYSKTLSANVLDTDKKLWLRVTRLLENDALMSMATHCDKDEAKQIREDGLQPEHAYLLLDAKILEDEW